ncbi:hypothetical protein B0H16DRAFT_1887792 [Mycena metata]|uniref:BTB domain-containing protein n=1 Tax=Mycena metata TaxID=1033252 RepID=A0AAD7IUC1_9AGAR|nr:hypothetical protein B0H16DRAFT_1887792 [Mycena metata]
MPRPPFDDSSRADTILQSSDGVDFHVSRLTLALASPFFSDLFSLPQPESEPKVPVIPVAESSSVLERLLGIWYPGVEPAVVIDGLEQLVEVLELAVSKYDIKFIAPNLQRHLENYLTSDPVAVYAIACRYRWADSAQMAARQLLKLPLPSILRSTSPHLRCISAELYQALLVYHIKCSEVAGSFGTALLCTNMQWAWMRCAGCAQGFQHPFLSEWPAGVRLPRNWILDYMQRAHATLKEAPGASVSDPVFFAPTFTRLKLSCHSTCSTSGLEDFANFVLDEYLPKLNQAVDAISLELDFGT